MPTSLRLAFGVDAEGPGAVFAFDFADPGVDPEVASAVPGELGRVLERSPVRRPGSGSGTVIVRLSVPSV